MSCTCENSKQNLGVVNCQELMKYAEHIFLIPLSDDAGVANKIAANTVLNNAAIIAKLNDTDASQRWYLLKNVKNAVIAERGDDVMQSFDDGSSVFIEEGVAKTSFIAAGQSPVFTGKLKSFRCEKMGFMFVDKDGKLWGYASDTTGDMYPIAIMDNSLSVKPSYPTPTSQYNINVSFEWSKDATDEGLASYSNTVSWVSTTIRSLLDILAGDVTGETTTGFTIALEYAYGDLNSKLPVKGLVAGDFTLYNVTDSASVTISTCTESPSGTYTFTFAAQTASDVIRLSGSKSGFDFTALESATIIL